MLQDIGLFLIGVVAINAVLVAWVAMFLAKRISEFRMTQNQLLLTLIIPSMATQEDKINLLLHDRGYTNETIDDWIKAQVRVT